MFYLFTSEPTPLHPDAKFSSFDPLFCVLFGIIVEESDLDRAVNRAETRRFPFDAKAKGLNVTCPCSACPERWSRHRYGAASDIRTLVGEVQHNCPLCTEPEYGHEAVLVLYADGTENFYYRVD